MKVTASAWRWPSAQILWHMNNFAGPSMALKVPEFRTTFSMVPLHFGKHLWRNDRVGPDGKRFADEKYKTSHGKVKIAGRWTPLSIPCPMFMIFDHTIFAQSTSTRKSRARDGPTRRAL